VLFRSNYMYRSYALTRLDRHHEAVATLTRWITSAIPAEMGYMRRGAVYEEMSEYSLALDDYRTAAGINPALHEYAELWIAIILHDQGDRAQADAILERIGAGGVTWTSHVAAYLAGSITQNELEKAASTVEQNAEFYYYVGIRALWDGDKEIARESFEACVASDRHTLFEREFARVRLAALGRTH